MRGIVAGSAAEHLLSPATFESVAENRGTGGRGQVIN